MYIKLSFKFQLWSVPQCAAGITACLTCKPELVVVLPDGVKANCYAEQQETMLNKELAAANYYYNCGDISSSEVEDILQRFNEHYRIDDEGKNLPATALESFEPSQFGSNKIIANLRIFHGNVTEPWLEEQPFAAVESDDEDEVIGAIL